MIEQKKKTAARDGCKQKHSHFILSQKGASGNMEKVKLPRHVAEALDEVRKWADIHGISAAFVAWCIPNKNMAEKHGEYWKTLYDFGNNGGFLKLIDAIRYGYDIEPEPITVTITPEMQEKAKKYFADLEAECKEAEKEGFTGTVRQIGSEIYGARYILKVLGITIPGVNA